MIETERPRPIVHLLLCHSPQDPGAATPNGWNERQLAADINGCIFVRLFARKFTVWRHEQDNLKRRIDLLKRAKDSGHHQVAIEVHLNAFPEPKTRGYMTLAHAKSPYGMRLASCIHAQVGELRGPDVPSLGVCGCDKEKRFAGTDKEFLQTRLALLEDTPQWACIPEPVTLSNPEDEKWILHYENRRKLGYAIATGIIEFFETLTLEV